MNISERKFLACQAAYGLMIALNKELPLVSLISKYTDEEFEALQEQHPEADEVRNIKLPQVNPINVMLLVRLSFTIADKMLEYDEITKDKAQFDLQREVAHIKQQTKNK